MPPDSASELLTLPGLSRAITIRVVGSHYRVTLPTKLSEAVDWLQFGGATIRLLSSPGSDGGIRIYSPDQAAALRERVGNISRRNLRIARALHSLFEVTIDAQRRLSLPEEARDLGLIPERGLVVVWGWRDVLEVWKRPEWIAQGRAIAEDVDELEEVE